MTRGVILLLLAVLVPGGCVLAYAVYRRQRWLAQEARAIDQLIKPPRRIYVGSDDRLRSATQRRRDQAARIKSQGRAMDTKDGWRGPARAVK